MVGDNFLTALAARLASIPFRLRESPPVAPPRKALILKPCCLSQVMLATPLLAALSEAYPQARFDWAVSEWARPAVIGNPRLTELIETGPVGLPGGSWAEVRALITRLRQEEYDTCFIPSRSSLLAYIAWRAGIPQRVGLAAGGRGFAHTLAVQDGGSGQHEADRYLALAGAFGIEAAARMEFHPPDIDRALVTERLVDEIDWLGDVPLVIIHPGGGDNPVRPDRRKQWPAERFALLGNYLVRRHEARVLLVGGAGDRSVAEAVAGLMSSAVPNLAGKMGLGELGALCEVADLYIGNDAGPTHIATAAGCPTLAIFGPSDPAISGPYGPKGRFESLRPQALPEPFSWEGVILADEAIAAAERLLLN